MAAKAGLPKRVQVETERLMKVAINQTQNFQICAQTSLQEPVPGIAACVDASNPRYFQVRLFYIKVDYAIYVSGCVVFCTLFFFCCYFLFSVFYLAHCMHERFSILFRLWSRALCRVHIKVPFLQVSCLLIHVEFSLSLQVVSSNWSCFFQLSIQCALPR